MLIDARFIFIIKGIVNSIYSMHAIKSSLINHNAIVYMLKWFVWKIKPIVLKI